MTIKRLIFRICVRSLEWLLMITPKKGDASWRELTNSRAEKDELDVIVIAFNNPFVIEQQSSFLKKNMTGQYKYMVVDNSSDKKQREKIKEVCYNNGVSYISLPANHLGLIGCSYSHAGALNWAYRKIIRRRKPAYFGFIDHDLFPVMKIDIRNRLSNRPVYGLLKKSDSFRHGCWYLWAGLCFFRYDFVQKKKVDFMPVTPFGDYLDTGGGNWYSIYSGMNPDSLNLAGMEYVEYPEMTGLLDDKMALMDDGVWLHTTNGSNWKRKKEDRNAVIDAVMRRFF